MPQGDLEHPPGAAAQEKGPHKERDALSDSEKANAERLDHDGGGHHRRHSTCSPNGARLSHSPRVTVPQFYGVGTFYRNFGTFINTPDAAITPGPLHAPLVLGRGSSKKRTYGRAPLECLE